MHRSEPPVHSGSAGEGCGLFCSLPQAGFSGGSPWKLNSMKLEKLRDCLKHLRRRCTDPSDPAYKNYGARGITYDPRWESFSAFISDMGDTWFPEATIDRIEADKGYFKNNCRWIVKADQTRVGRLSTRSDNKTGVPGVEKVRHGWRVLVRTASGKKTLYFGGDFEKACRIRKEWEDLKKAGTLPILSRKDDPNTRSY